MSNNSLFPIGTRVVDTVSNMGEGVISAHIAVDGPYVVHFDSYAKSPSGYGWPMDGHHRSRHEVGLVFPDLYALLRRRLSAIEEEGYDEARARSEGLYDTADLIRDKVAALALADMCQACLGTEALKPPAHVCGSTMECPDCGRKVTLLRT